MQDRKIYQQFIADPNSVRWFHTQFQPKTGETEDVSGLYVCYDPTLRDTASSAIRREMLQHAHEADCQAACTFCRGSSRARLSLSRAPARHAWPLQHVRHSWTSWSHTPCPLRRHEPATSRWHVVAAVDCNEMNQQCGLPPREPLSSLRGTDHCESRPKWK